MKSVFRRKTIQDRARHDASSAFEAQVSKAFTEAPHGRMEVAGLGSVHVDDSRCVFYVPAKQHRIGRRCTAAYHSRVQKKWNKVFGMKRMEHSYYVAGTLVVSLQAYKNLKSQLGDRSA